MSFGGGDENEVRVPRNHIGPADAHVFPWFSAHSSGRSVASPPRVNQFCPTICGS
jgi:hypothetical protein